MHRTSTMLLQMTINNLYHGNYLMKTTSPVNALIVLKNFYSSKPLHKLKPYKPESKPAIIEYLYRVLNKTHYFNPDRYRLMYLGYYLYENAVDTSNYNEFYEEFKLPDTFNSWFIVTELHVWLMMIRCMAEGDKGKIVRNNMVKALWEDCSQRGKKLHTKEDPVNERIVKKQIIEISAQFNAVIVSYDEGITGDDKVLASAVWRRFFKSEGNDPEKVEKLVHYIRKQNHLLEQTPWDEIRLRKAIDWQGLSITKTS